MSKTKFQDELKRFEIALGKTTLTAEQERKYMNIKAELLECNKRAHCWKSSLVKPITRYRNGKESKRNQRRSKRRRRDSYRKDGISRP